MGTCICCCAAPLCAAWCSTFPVPTSGGEYQHIYAWQCASFTAIVPLSFTSLQCNLSNFAAWQCALFAAIVPLYCMSLQCTLGDFAAQAPCWHSCQHCALQVPALFVHLVHPRDRCPQARAHVRAYLIPKRDRGSRPGLLHCPRRHHFTS